MGCTGPKGCRGSPGPAGERGDPGRCGVTVIIDLLGDDGDPGKSGKYVKCSCYKVLILLEIQLTVLLSVHAV